MSAPLRFLGVIAVGWVAFRAGALWSVPGAEGMALRQTREPLPAAGTVAGPLVSQPVAPAEEAYGYPPHAYAAPQPYPYPPPPAYGYAQPYPALRPVPVRIPVYYPVYQAVQPVPAERRRPLDLDLSSLAPAEDWSLAQLTPLPSPAHSTRVAVPAARPGPPRLDRLQLSSWALLRGQATGTGLASGGTLGGSQAGARLTYAFDRQLAAQLRTTTPVGGGRGAEVALGARYQPLRSIPLWINAERRQSIGDYGRNAFALFAEGGLYQRPLPWQLRLDAYLQAGIVGINRRDYFVDGAFTATRPLFRNYSLGAGIWGGAQPGLYRVDAGPRLSMKVRDNIRIHADWRQRLAGEAEPGSGPALTLAADF